LIFGTGLTCSLGATDAGFSPKDRPSPLCWCWEPLGLVGRRVPCDLGFDGFGAVDLSLDSLEVGIASFLACSTLPLESDLRTFLMILPNNTYLLNQFFILIN
jgi:hypothetical protein